MKLECSSSVFCAKQVHTTEEVLKYVRIVQDMVNINFKHSQHGLGETSSLILMKQLIGTEHNIDLIMFQGQLMAAFVSDYGPSYKPLCIQTICAMPSVLCHGMFVFCCNYLKIVFTLENIIIIIVFIKHLILLSLWALYKNQINI